MVLKLAMYGTYNSDIQKNFKPVLIIVTVLIIYLSFKIAFVRYDVFIHKIFLIVTLHKTVYKTVKIAKRA